MEPCLVVGQVSTVQVVVSREPMYRVDRPTDMGGQAQAAPQQPLLVEVIPRANLEVIGRAEVKLQVPAPDEPRLVQVDVRATHPGTGELWVLVRQAQLPLLTLVLTPRILTEPPATGEETATAVGVAALDPEPVRHLTILRVIEQRFGEGFLYRFDLDVPDLGLLKAYASRLI